MAKEPFAAQLSSIWIGGLFHWMLKGFAGKYTDQIAEKHTNRNLWTGYIIHLIALAFLVYFVFIKNL
jgi:hypothetical protein